MLIARIHRRGVQRHGSAFFAVALALGVSAVPALALDLRAQGTHTDFNGNADVARGVLVQPDGKVVAAGWAEEPGEGSVGAHATTYRDDVALARYLPNGRLDRDFGRRGRVQTDVSGDMDYASAVVRQDDGKLAIAGSSQTGDETTDEDFLVIRYRRNGSLDRSFGDDGIVTVSFQPGSLPDNAFDLDVQRDGKIVVVGTARLADDVAEHRDMAVARLRPNGVLDRSFSGDGLVTVDFAGDEAEVARAVEVQRNGRILLGGVTRSSADFALARLMPDGSYDSSFSGDGRLTTTFTESEDPDWCQTDDRLDDLVVRARRIFAVGYSAQCTAGSFAAARYHLDGRLDEGFGREGRVISPGGRKPILGWAYDAVVSRDRTMLVGGLAVGKDSTRYEPDVDFALAQLTPAGRLDRSFSADGIKSRDLGDDWDSPYSMAATRGRAYVAGTSPRHGQWDWAIVRFRTR